MAFSDKEKFSIIFLDKRNQVIADEVQQTGTVDHTPVYPREVVKRALELSATAVTRDRSLSAQFEHTIAVTATGVEIFTTSPKGLDKPPYKTA